MVLFDGDNPRSELRMNSEMGDVNPVSSRSAVAVTIGAQIRALRGTRSQKAFADQYGVSLNTLRRYESGDTTADADLLVRLVEGENVSMAWLFGLEGKAATHSSTGPVSVKADGNKLIEIDPNDYIYVPVFDVAFGAGPGGTINFDEPPIAWDAYRRTWAREQGLLGAELFKGTIRGDSMYPILQDGQTALFNASSVSIRSGEIYCVRIGDEHIVKYLRNLPGGQVEISSHNPDPKHAPFIVRAEEFGNGVEIVGSLVR